VRIVNLLQAVEHSRSASLFAATYLVLLCAIIRPNEKLETAFALASFFQIVIKVVLSHGARFKRVGACSWVRIDLWLWTQNSHHHDDAQTLSRRQDASKFFKRIHSTTCNHTSSKVWFAINNLVGIILLFIGNDYTGEVNMDPTKFRLTQC
jgi:hypothetical protein